MPEVIKVTDRVAPLIICPHCAEKNLIDVTIWREDVTKIFQDKCRSCHGTIVVGMLIVSDTTMAKLLSTIQAIASMVKQEKFYSGK